MIKRCKPLSLRQERFSQHTRLTHGPPKTIGGRGEDTEREKKGKNRENRNELKGKKGKENNNADTKVQGSFNSRGNWETSIKRERKKEKREKRERGRGIGKNYEENERERRERELKVGQVR